MRFEDWLDNVSIHIKHDPLWNLVVYQKALFFSDIVWHDCELLLKHELGHPIVRQLIRSAGSISANMEEGFGPGYGKDYGRFLKTALGSAHESRGWYFRGRHLLKPAVLDHRMELLRTIIAGLITMSNQQSQY